ncbi:MAG: OmpA family protein [Gemmatimonadota bacterium]|jgi:peptidoglycan-associated lipoprotein
MSSGAWKLLIKRTGVLVATGAIVAGCARVKPEELDAALADIRTEMQAGDQRVSGEVATLGGRVDGLESRLDALESRLTQLAQEFDATVERLETAIRFDMPVYFDFDSSDLTDSHRQILSRFAGVVREYYPTALITAEGFTDAVGTPEYNEALGLRRADAVKDFLVQQGLSGDQVRSVSYGEAQNRQVSSAHGPGSEGWENRRVALVIDHGA